MQIRKDDYFCEIFIEKSCQKFANLSQDIAVVRQVDSSAETFHFDPEWWLLRLDTVVRFSYRYAPVLRHSW